MFDWQTPGYPEDLAVELQALNQERADRLADYAPSSFPGRIKKANPQDSSLTVAGASASATAEVSG